MKRRPNVPGQPSAAIARFGTDEPQPVRTVVSCGPVSAVLEAGALRTITYRNSEILRSIAFLVRDVSWDTAPTEISRLIVDQQHDSFHITFDATCRTRDGTLTWTADISGAADGTIDFRSKATPEIDFSTNRTGFVILHPLEGVVGEPVEIVHSNGKKTAGRFPTLIDPEPCFTDIIALTSSHPSGLQVACEMAGGSWEMEDHRNWLDASFKTYIRPLALPYPYVLPAGQPVEQHVRVRVTERGKGRRPVPRTSAAIELSLGAAAATVMPSIGLRAGRSWLSVSAADLEPARQTGMQLLHGRVDLCEDGNRETVRRLAQLCKRLGARLALEIIVPCKSNGSERLRVFAAWLIRSRVECESIAVAPSDDCIRMDPGPPPPPMAMLAELYSTARECFPRQILGGGVASAFAELNRNWPPSGLVDFVFYPIGSLVHACDDQTMVENLQSIPAGMATAGAFGGGKPVRIIQSTLGLDLGLEPRKAGEHGPRRTTLAQLDPRHRGLFGAAWALGAVANAAKAGATAIAPAALAGEFGLAHVATPFHQPWFDDAAPGGLYPIFHVVKQLAGVAGRRVRELRIADVHRLSGIAVTLSRRRVVILAANTTNGAVRLKLPESAGARCIMLDEHSFPAAAGDAAFFGGKGLACATRTIELPPFAFARLDLELSA